MSPDMEYIVDQVKAVLAIDSPTSYTKAAASYVLEEYRRLGFQPEMTAKGGVLVCLNPEAPEEDSLLVLYKQSGGNWAEVAEHIPGRTAKQCRERWCNHINPDIRKGDWSVVEDNIIVSLQKQWGNRWSAIAEVALRGTGDVAIAGSLGEFGEDSVEDAVSEGNSQCSG